MPPVFPAHWHVSQPVLIADTFSSLVWKVSLPDGTPAIVKGLKPIEDIADELRGADYLVWRNGRGAVRLLGRENNLMLLEYAGERMLSHRCRARRLPCDRNCSGTNGEAVCRI